MKPRHPEDGRFSLQGRGLGTVTEAMVRERASELAVMNGRGKHNILDSDLEQARRELSGEEGLNPSRTEAEKIPEENRWEVTPDSTGKKTEAMAASDEQTFAEKLVEEGIADAEHEQEVEATRESLRKEDS
jgi:hypothetical protein